MSVDPRVVLFSGFILTGIVNTALGPVLPWLAMRWHLSDVSAGSLFTVQFVGGLIGGAISGLLSAIGGTGRTMATGYALMAVGMLVMALGDKPFGIVGIAAAGVGLGFVSPLTNLTAARLAPARAAAALGAVNLCWGLGAAIWPLAVAAAAARSSVQSAIVIVCALLALAPVPFALARFPTDAPPAVGDGAAKHPGVARLVLLGCCIALYSGSEAAFGGWVTEYARRLALTAPTSRWELAASAFWGGLTAGRAAVAVWLTRRWETPALFAGLAAVASAILLLLAAPGVNTVLAAAALCGAGLGPIFPVTVAALARGFPLRMAGPMVAMGSLGAAIIPLIVGTLSERAGSLSSGFAALLVFVTLLAALQIVRVRSGS